MVLTQEDIKAIAMAVVDLQKQDPAHPCRFARVAETELEQIVRIHKEVNDDDLREAVKFFKNFNKAMSDTGQTLWKLLLTLGFGTVVTLIVIGLITEVKTRMGL